MNKLAYSVEESFEIAGGVSRSTGYSRMRAGTWAPVRYINGKPVVLHDELIEFLRALPTERTHKRGGYRARKEAS